MHSAPSGRTLVHHKDFLKALHEHKPQPIVTPFDGDDRHTLELHHWGHPQGGRPRDFDAAVIPLLTSGHQGVEFEGGGGPWQRAHLSVFGEWSALHWWAYHQGLLDDPDKGQKFLLWVVQQVEKERKA